MSSLDSLPPFPSTFLGWSAVDQRNSWTEIEQLGELQDLLCWKADYLTRSHIRDATGQTVTLYGQAGSGSIDHDFWGTAVIQTMPRLAYAVTPTQSGSDLTAEAASTLAVTSMAFAEIDSAYAVELLDHARVLYDFADVYRGKHSDTIIDASGFYPSSHFENELAWGALWLHRAAGEVDYLAKTRRIALRRITSPTL
ncbi:MAG: Endoglucanase E-4 [Verrucomicrobia subdivision 3 bacterium]|nr:Endoglucanase E-4 [Limisphaerales bacterium]MCS1415301.1 Endoglucanase E-4 [Limisphaerales bacterium]